MGCAPSAVSTDSDPDADPDPRSTTSAIDMQLKHDRRATSRRATLLLLGTGDSGKSTFAKQMMLLHAPAESPSPTPYPAILRDNCLTSSQGMLRALEGKGGLGDRLRLALDTIKTATELTPVVADAIVQVWANKRVRKVVGEKESVLQLPSSYPYFLLHAPRFASRHFSPTQEDMLRARVPTVGVRESQFVVNGWNFTLVDVGGQRSERRKWLSCFEGVNAVIFVAALDEYDKPLEEDPRTNRMLESLALFEHLTGLDWFSRTPFLLFLNKVDLFELKLKLKPLHLYFHGLDPLTSSDLETAAELVQTKYEDAYRGQVGGLYPFLTCALDTQNCQRVFDSVRDNVLLKRLRETF